MVNIMPMNAQQLGYVIGHLNGAIASLEHAAHMATPLEDDGNLDDTGDAAVRQRVKDVLSLARETQYIIMQIKRGRTAT